MGEYGYNTYQNFSTYGPRRDEASGPAKRKPFVPFVPKSNRNPEEYVTGKTVVPVAISPYGDEYSRNGSPTWTNRTRDDDGYWRRRTSPVHSHPNRFTSAATTERRGASGYGEYGNREEQYWAVGSGSGSGSPVRNDNYYGINGYGDYKGNGREWQKPIGTGYSIGVQNDNYDNDGYQPPISYSSGANNSPGWTAPPRNGTRLSEPTNDIGKALGLLKEAVRMNGHADYGNKGRPKLDREGYNYNFTNRHF